MKWFSNVFPWLVTKQPPKPEPRRFRDALAFDGYGSVELAYGGGDPTILEVDVRLPKYNKRLTVRHETTAPLPFDPNTVDLRAYAEAYALEEVRQYAKDARMHAGMDRATYLHVLNSAPVVTATPIDPNDEGSEQAVQTLLDYHDKMSQLLSNVQDCEDGITHCDELLAYLDDVCPASPPTLLSELTSILRP